MQYIDFTKTNNSTIDIVPHVDFTKSPIPLSDAKELTGMVRALKALAPLSKEAFEQAYNICKLADCLPHYRKIAIHAHVMDAMGWGKREFSKTLKGYREAWYSNNNFLTRRDTSIPFAQQLENDVCQMTDGTYYNFKYECIQSSDVLNRLYKDSTKDGMLASDMLDINPNKQIASGYRWQPCPRNGKLPRIVEYEGHKYINIYSVTNIKPTSGDVSRWLTLCNFIYKENVSIVLDHMAYTTQFPDKQITWGILGYGAAETGRILSVKPLLRICNNNDAEPLNGKDIDTATNDILYQKKVLIVDDIGMKGSSLASQDNICSMYLFSNDDACLEFTGKSLFVVKTPLDQLNESFYESLVYLIKTDKYISHIFDFLMSRNLASFNPRRPPI